MLAIKHNQKQHLKTTICYTSKLNSKGEWCLCCENIYYDWFSLIKVRTKSTLYFPAAPPDWSTTSWLLLTILCNVPCVLWPCLTHVANDCWKFLFCWNVTGVPILVDSTTLVLGVPWPESEPTMTLGVAAGVAGVPVGVAVTDPGFCSRRFWDGI